MPSNDFHTLDYAILYIRRCERLRRSFDHLAHVCSVDHQIVGQKLGAQVDRKAEMAISGAPV